MYNDPRLKSRLIHLIKNRQSNEIAKEFLGIEAKLGTVNLTLLSVDPLQALKDHPHVEVVKTHYVDSNCSLLGYYEPRDQGKSRILYRPTGTASRDFFTIIHEYAHHIQHNSDSWIEALSGQSSANWTRIEENVAHAFAAQALIPDSLLSDEKQLLDVNTLRNLHERTKASRAAIVMKAINANQDIRAAFVVSSLDGEIIFAAGTDGNVATAKKGSQQSTLLDPIKRALETEEGIARRIHFEGFISESNWSQDDLLIDVAIDHLRSFAFIYVRPAGRYSHVPGWSLEKVECSRSACSTVFTITSKIKRCKVCYEPHCPECGVCSCDLPVASQCLVCFAPLSQVETTHPEVHECW